ncbi:MAG: DUF1080 domain-containing protein [Bacteroidota bacterium]
MLKSGGKIWLSVFVLIVVALYCCTSGNTVRTYNCESSNDSVLNPDSSYMFDGETLEGWEITNFGPQGPVYVSGGSIILGMGEGCTGITWKGNFPETDYRVTLEAKRVSGNDFFCGITFPVGKESCSLIIGGWGGPVVGLSSIDRKDASENETTRLMQFESDNWYKICFTVTGDTIKASIDDDLIVDFVKGDKTLSIRPEVELSKPFGIASWNTTAALRNIQLEKFGKQEF